MKKLIAILLAVLMIVSALVSCGGNDETTTTETTTTEPPTPEPPAEDNNDNNDTEEVYGNAILYIKRLSGPIALNYKNVFEATSEYFDNSHKVSSKVTININGENITLDYDESFYDIMKGYLVNKYGSKKPQYIVSRFNCYTGGTK